MNPATATISRAWLPVVSWRGRHAAQIAIGGYLAGFSILPNEWFHLGCLALAGLLALGKPQGYVESVSRPRDVGPWLVGAFLAWMTLRSLFTGAVVQGQVLDEILRGLVGTLLLVLFVLLMWSVSRDRSFLRAAAWITVLPAAFAAAISIVAIHFLLPGHHPDERLANLFVHGGLNAVCTGLIFGFSGMWLAVWAGEPRLPLPRPWVWSLVALLHLAAFMSGSRGAMLALVCGHAALLAAQGGRRSRVVVAIFAVTGLFHFTSAPVLAGIHSLRAVTPPGSPPLTRHLQEALRRGDNGRREIYRAGWKNRGNLWAGTGQWGVREAWQRDVQGGASSVTIHLHSAFFATFVHGGFIGLSLLIAIIALASRRAWRLARQGDPAWIALLAFGCGGLLFDGESLTSLATAPRFEGLLFWLPVTVALACGREK